ncbi:MAG: acyl--CoA ligase [Betaproteobacteria bacterium]|nr:acyl--CoA ligase [Betaproteobacteria bacterium]
MQVEAGYLVRVAAERYPERTALVEVERGISLSFSSLNQRANRLGSGLLALGLRRGDRVGVVGYNCMELLESWFGLEKHGLVRAVLHSHFPMSMHARCLQPIGARGLIFTADFAEVVESHLDQIPDVECLVCVGPRKKTPRFAHHYEDVIAAGTDAEPRLQVDENDACTVQFTSGTTGLPKPWVKTYRCWLTLIQQHLYINDRISREPVNRDDVNLHLGAIQHGTGVNTLYPYIFHGCKSVLVGDRTFDPEKVLSVMNLHQVTGVLIPAPKLREIMARLAAPGTKCPGLKRLIVPTGGPDSVDAVRRLWGDCISRGYGSTETGTVTHLLMDDYLDGLAAGKHRRCTSSIGRPMTPLVEVRIVGTDLEPVPTNEVGEIVVRSAMSDGYYWKRPDLMKAAFLPGNWFRTGDLGYRDSDGYFYYIDRKSDCIATAQGLVYPHIVENAIAKHPAVERVAAIGVPGSQAESVKACVRLKEGHGPEATVRDELLLLCRRELLANEVPSSIDFVVDLPLVAGGLKVRRSEVRRRQLERDNRE